MSGAYCKKHDEQEPYDWDSQYDGIWICPCCSRESMKKFTQRDAQGRKPLDVAIEKIRAEHPELFRSK